MGEVCLDVSLDEYLDFDVELSKTEPEINVYNFDFYLVHSWIPWPSYTLWVNEVVIWDKSEDEHESENECGSNMIEKSANVWKKLSMSSIRWKNCCDTRRCYSH